MRSRSRARCATKRALFVGAARRAVDARCRVARARMTIIRVVGGVGDVVRCAIRDGISLLNRVRRGEIRRTTPARGDSRRLNEVGKALGQRRLDPRHGFAEIGELADVGESQVTLARGAEVGAGQERDAGVL